MATMLLLLVVGSEKFEVTSIILFMQEYRPICPLCQCLWARCSHEYAVDQCRVSKKDTHNCETLKVIKPAATSVSLVQL
jgi:hypothetical protein